MVRAETRATGRAYAIGVAEGPLETKGITEESELPNVRRALWAIEVPEDLPMETPRLAQRVLTGGIRTYEECRKEARRLRTRGAACLRASSATLLPELRGLDGRPCGTPSIGSAGARTTALELPHALTGLIHNVECRTMPHRLLPALPFLRSTSFCSA